MFLGWVVLVWFCFCFSSFLAQFALSQASATLQILHEPVRLHLCHETKHARLVLGIAQGTLQSNLSWGEQLLWPKLSLEVAEISVRAPMLELIAWTFFT